MACPGADRRLWGKRETGGCDGVIGRMRPRGKVIVLILKVVKWTQGEEAGMFLLLRDNLKEW